MLTVLAANEQASQLQLAGRLGVDRTTMVALLDGLQRRGLVTRRAHSEDRRRNAVELTATGRDVFEHATKAGDEAERRFLAPLSPHDAEQLRKTLRLHPPRTRVAGRKVRRWSREPLPDPYVSSPPTRWASRSTA